MDANATLASETANGATPAATASSSGAPPTYSRLAPLTSQDLESASHGANSSSVSADGLQFDIVPRPDDSSFQAGYQGLQPSGFDVWLRGDVLLKPPGTQSRTSQTVPSSGSGTIFADRFSQCTIDLLATEKVAVNGTTRSCQLFHASHVLWRSASLPQSSGSSVDLEGTARCIPTTMPFKFSLPSHLPHCIHLPHVKLEYQLIAALHPSSSHHEQEVLTRSINVHLTRYSLPGPINHLLPTSQAERFSEQPKIWNVSNPTRMEVRLQKTIFRRAEMIKMRLQVQPPDEKSIDQGLRIRSVEAELLRIVTSRDTARASQSAQGQSRPASLGGKGKKSARDLLSASSGASADANSSWPGSSESSRSSTSAVPRDVTTSFENGLQGQAHANGQNNEDRSSSSFLTVLAHSGKSCRFSRRKPIVLHLTLVPPFSASTLPHPSPDHDAPPSGLSPLNAGTSGGGGGCESITQESELSDVEFKVRIWIRLRGTTADSAGAEGSTRQSRGRANTTNRDVMLEQPVYILPGLAGGPEPVDESILAAEDAEEYDGYEDFNDVHDSWGSDVPSVNADGVDTRSAPPSFAAASAESDRNGAMTFINGNPAFTTIRASGEGAEDPPPNVEQSQHDMLIFPPLDAVREEEELPPPPIHSPQVISGLEQGGGPQPPGWAESQARNSFVFIEGVGEGEIRQREGSHLHGPFLEEIQGWQFSRAGSTSPPPDFSNGPLDQAETSVASTASGNRLPPLPLQPVAPASATEPPPYMQPLATSSVPEASSSRGPPPQAFPSAEEEKAALAVAASESLPNEGQSSRGLPPAYAYAAVAEADSQDPSSDSESSEESDADGGDDDDDDDRDQQAMLPDHIVQSLALRLNGTDVGADPSPLPSLPPHDVDRGISPDRGSSGAISVGRARVAVEDPARPVGGEDDEEPPVYEA